MPKKHRLAYFDQAAVLSGAELALHNLLTALDGERWMPHVILGRSGPLKQRLCASGVSVEILPMPTRLLSIPQDRLRTSSFLNPALGLGAVNYVVRLARTLRGNRLELMHANSLRGCILAGIAARLSRLPVIWHVHSIVATPMVAPEGVKLYRWLARWLPHHIICNSRFTAASFDVPSDRLSIIAPGLDPSRFTPNGQRSTRGMRIGMVGRIAPWKGQHIFIDAVRLIADRYPNAEFLLAGQALFGEDVYERAVRDRAIASVGDRIRFLDFVDDIPGLLRDLDIVVHASVQPEPFGQVIVEAMMAGKPVIAAAAGGPLDLIEDGVTGRLVPPGDSAALATAMRELICDRASAYRMGREARARALERYDIQRTAAAIEDVYERVLAVA
jgi:glycosyltransferase involved in cell wall biosynthesis